MKKGRMQANLTVTDKVYNQRFLQVTDQLDEKIKGVRNYFVI